MTKASSSPRKQYNEGCIAAHALDFLGDRWALLVIRELLLGPKRFSLIRSGLPGISANILTQRLKELETSGLIVHQLLPPPASVQIYALTILGHQVRPVIGALCRFGAQLPGNDPLLHISPTALMLSMTEMFVPCGAKEVSIAFNLGAEQFLATANASGFAPVRTHAPTAQLNFSGKANDLAATIYGPRPLSRSVADGIITFHGDLEIGQAFVDLFSLKHRALDGLDYLEATVSHAP